MKAIIRVYLKSSQVYEYDIEESTAEALGVKAREHCGQIWATGYRHNDGKGSFEWFGSHWIDKIKVTGEVSTVYPDRSLGT